MASESPQFLEAPFSGHGLNNYIARATSPRTPSTSRPRLTRIMSEESRTGTSGLYHKWSKSSPKTPKTPKSFEGKGGDMDEVEQARLRAQLPRSMVSPKPLSLLGIGMGSKHKDGLLPRRRKEGLSDLSLETMTTVQEYPMDSPTIPGRPPTSRAPRKSPKDSPRSSRWGRGSLTPRATMVQNREPEVDEYQQSAVPSSDSEASDIIEIKPSSAPLSKTLAPLKIPSNQYMLPAQAYRPTSPPQSKTPPQVPPKSPRTMSRASPHSRTSPISANSSSSTLHTANSSMTSLSATEDTALSAKPWSAPPRGFSPRVHQRDFAPASAGTPSPLPWVLKPMNGSPSRHGRGGMSIDSRSAPPKTPNSLRSGSVPSIPFHSIPSQDGQSIQQGIAQESSVINRGRPMKRGDISLQRTLSRSVKNAISISENFSELPVGLHRLVAMDVMSPEELRSLTRWAESKATTYQVLYENHVSNMSKELHLLDDRCEYLRRTYTSLKEGRQGLHERMIAYLKGWRCSSFLRENMLKQELALTELDASIEEWRTKLERAEERRSQIQIKMLEHIAAAVTLKVPGSPNRYAMQEEQTPPRSPEKVDRSFSTERRDVESIRVYADSGVAALLASIEQEIDMMERTPEM